MKLAIYSYITGTNKFQLLLKGCTIEAKGRVFEFVFSFLFQLLLKGCTIEAENGTKAEIQQARFQLLLKGCTIEALNWGGMLLFDRCVSVVVERMYD